MKNWAIALVTLAIIDVLTTYICLPLGAIESNPLFAGTDIRTMGLMKVGITVLLAYICVRLKLRTILIMMSGANAGMVTGNLMAIWTLKTM